MLSWLQHRWTAFYLLLMALGALSLFLYGFFPLKYHTGQMTHYDDLPNFIDGVSIDGQTVYNPGENTVVLMVIDGLRYDFATEEYMPNMGKLLKNKSACIYVSVAEPPTVTMPRIKSPERKKEKAQWRRTINFWRDIFASVTFCNYLCALLLMRPKKKLAMMTGSVSTFADVALNFGAPAVRGDSVLRVAKSRGRRSVMYGDDTWLRLFPGLWAESEGTTSFFVTDYTEVDNNVTRHLDKILAPDEKQQPSFDFLVLHYLGLDHIGHLEGARSAKIRPKLVEMDEVVKKIFTAMQQWDRKGILMICGDHGMRDAGGHGGATPAEVLVPLVILQSRDFECPHPLGPGPTVAQVDVAPTIAWLLNAPIPGDSGGRLLPSVQPRDTRQRLYLLHYVATHNARAVIAQLGDGAMEKEFYKQLMRAEKQFGQYLATGQKSAAKIAIDFYEEALDVMAEHLSESTTDFDMFAIVTAVVLLYVIATSIVCVTLYSLQRETNREYSASQHARNRSKGGATVAFLFIAICAAVALTLACAITETKSNLCTLNPLWILAFISAAVVLSSTFFLTKSAIEYNMDLTTLHDLNSIDYLLIGGTLFHSWSFFGTSFIEEEHMTWYFFWNTLMFFILVRTVSGFVMYTGKLYMGATEVQDKPQLKKKMLEVGFTIMPRWIILIALHRYLRTMNQTGDRWLFLPDTADWLNAPENSVYLQVQLLLGTLLTLAICLRNLQYTNNILQMHSALTILSTACIILYRMATVSLPAVIPDITTWDTVTIVNIFWGLMIAQMVFEILTYAGIFRTCGHKPYTNPDNEPLSDNKFIYNKPKAKTEDFIYPSYDEEPWNSEKVKMNLIRSISHIVLNDMMLIVVLLMRPHNVIMVPGIYFTCKLTAKCLEHNLLDTRTDQRTEIVDILSQTLVHLWIGELFFFYQGNSNSLASVDLGSGYVGLREYSPFAVAARMGLHAYAAPALAGCCLYCVLAVRADTLHKYFQSVWRATNIFAAQRVYSLLIYSVVATVFRHHLFVWTVFSPKLLYDFVATVFTIQALVTIAEIIGLAYLTSWLARMVTFKTSL